MREIVIPLIGAALFLFGLMQVSDGIHLLVDQSAVIGGFVVMMAGALLLSVEMSRW
jgi:hypothetical protein